MSIAIRPGLASEAEARLRAQGARRLAAIVIVDDSRATGFWRRSGWKEQARRIRFVAG